MLTLQTKTELLAHLRSEIAACERSGSTPDRTVILTGWPALDGVLPLGGIPRGSLVEFLDERAGSGAETCAVVLTRAACRAQDLVVVLDREQQFYPPAVAAWGLALDELVVVHALTDAEELWAADQALRSLAVGAVWLRRDRLRPHDFRRLRLAAEEGGTLGVLLRPIRLRGQPTWADLQLCVVPRPSPHGRKLCVEVTRCRGGAAGRAVEVELDDVTGAVQEVDHHETLRVPAAAALADPAAVHRATGTAGPSAARAAARRPPR